jgi:hypothetical protein
MTEPTIWPENAMRDRIAELDDELAALEWKLRHCMEVSTKYMAEHTGVEWHESDIDEALEHLDEAWAERRQK